MLTQEQNIGRHSKVGSGGPSAENSTCWPSSDASAPRSMCYGFVDGEKVLVTEVTAGFLAIFRSGVPLLNHVRWRCATEEEDTRGG
ncbi:hypothetical protein NECAME_02181 [Necator americanus]|uniref:Uncharacterized protein n=1 Tax=Necator americanus TaxID=51031 RepID=W2THR7_NECAM|nr:hypothetical protein NECAME_02181 [Necator americanus]ETN81139.1 hypothetical protein NECAME_02181 [Necator americanus]